MRAASSADTAVANRETVGEEPAQRMQHARLVVDEEQ